MTVQPFAFLFRSRPGARAGWRDWRRYFERNSRRPLPLRLRAREDEARGFQTLPAPELQALLRCLAIFQKGEAGEGRIAREIDGVRLALIDDDFRRALKFFVAEEGRHARLLAMLILGLGGRVLASSKIERLFVRARRLLGVRFKLLVLAAAEICGIVMYTIFARRLLVGRCRNILREIIRDEKSHLRFHAAFFRAGLGVFELAWLAPLFRLSFRLVWRGLTRAACLTMMLAMREDLRILNISYSRVWAAFVHVGGRMEDWVLERS